MEFDFNTICNRMRSHNDNRIAEFEEFGEIKNYSTSDPKLQEIERYCIHALVDLKKEQTMEHHAYMSSIKQILRIGPWMTTPVMDVSITVLEKFVGECLGKSVLNLHDLLMAMSELQEKDMECILESNVDKESSQEDDMFSDIKTPTNFPMPSLFNKAPKLMFPTPSQMQKGNRNEKLMTPASAFRFEGVPPSTNKAPRPLKPGEEVFSQSGSPLLIPKLREKPAAISGQIPVNDDKGEKYAEVVIYNYQPNKEKDCRELLTDIRGIAATRSTVKQNRVRPPRLPRAPASARGRRK